MYDFIRKLEEQKITWHFEYINKQLYIVYGENKKPWYF